MRRRNVTVRGIHEPEYQRAVLGAQHSASSPACTREGKWLELLAWVAGSLRALRGEGRTFATEMDQRLALLQGKRQQIGRIPDSDTCLDIALASQTIWVATQSLAAERAA